MHYDNLITFGNLESNIAIVTLWTQKEHILSHIDIDKVAVVGQLYSKNEGISAIIRGCLRNKKIRYILVYGNDLSYSGQALLLLSEKGIDNNWSIKEVDNSYLDQNIPLEAIERFRQNVKIIDCRTKGIKFLIDTIDSLEKKDSYGEAEEYPFLKKDFDTYPSEKNGIVIRKKTIGQCYIDILYHILRFGEIKKSEYSDDQKELINLIAVFSQDSPVEGFFNFSEKDLESYIPQVLSKNKIDGVEYTYGERLFDHNGVNQIEEIIRKIKKNPYTRRAIAFTWNVDKDYNSPKCPCLDLVQFIVQEGSIYLTAYFRSNDMFGAWPRNAFALRELQKMISIRTNLSLGDLTTISCSAHIYKENWISAEKIVLANKDNYQEFDPRGNIIITLKDGLIHLVHSGKKGFIDELYEKNLDNIFDWLKIRISDISHAFYLGTELRRAKYALDNDLEYIQDT